MHLVFHLKFFIMKDQLISSFLIILVSNWSNHSILWSRNRCYLGSKVAKTSINFLRDSRYSIQVIIWSIWSELTCVWMGWYISLVLTRLIQYFWSLEFFKFLFSIVISIFIIIFRLSKDLNLWICKPSSRFALTESRWSISSVITIWSTMLKSRTNLSALTTKTRGLVS
jgi:hypothetical protein